VIVVDHYLARRVGIPAEYAARTGTRFNVAVLLAWTIPVLVALYFYRAHEVNAFFLPLPTWLACGALYIVFTRLLYRTPTLAP
jgi:NCS1 family nucleobase:cation symporter-1